MGEWREPGGAAHRAKAEQAAGSLGVRRARRAVLPFAAVLALLAAFWMPPDSLPARGLDLLAALAAGVFGWAALGDRVWNAAMRTVLGGLGLAAASAAVLGAVPGIPRSGVLPWVAATLNLSAGLLCVLGISTRRPERAREREA